jgi:hypothetical protein
MLLPDVTLPRWFAQVDLFQQMNGYDCGIISYAAFCTGYKQQKYLLISYQHERKRQESNFSPLNTILYPMNS